MNPKLYIFIKKTKEESANKGHFTPLQVVFRQGILNNQNLACCDGCGKVVSFLLYEKLLSFETIVSIM